MQKIEFTKMHGLGNDFVIIDNREKIIPITEQLIRKLSDRRTGAGCDQLITINKPKGNEDIIIEIFNPSGDKAEACGNGTRCVAKLLFQESNKEQKSAGLNDCNDAEIKLFEELNHQYFIKFNLPFIMAVKEKNKSEILSSFKSRQKNTVSQERLNALSEINKIAWLRIKEIYGL